MSRTVRENVIHPITLRRLEVAAVRDSPGDMVRVTLAGPQLGAFESNGFAQPAFRSPGFDDNVRLVFTYPDDDAPVLPIQKDGNVEAPKDRRPLTKSYTVRGWDPDAGEVHVDFVKHGTGVATTWARRCRPGDPIHIVGPAMSGLFPAGVDWLLVAGDETALPAIGRLLEEAPAGLRVQAFIEVDDAAGEVDLATRADATITWLHRDGAEPGTTTLLADAVRAAPWWPGEAYAWVAGESMNVKPIRRFLREVRELPRESVDVAGYWRRETVVTMPDDPAVPDSEQIEEPFDVLHEMAEMAPPFALRAAVTLGLPELIANGTTGVAELAGAAGADARAIGKLLRYLAGLDVVTSPAPGRYELTAVGDLLTEEFVVGILDLDGAVGRQELGFAGLLDSVRTGRESYGTVWGAAFPQLRTDPAFEASFQGEISRYARFLAPALATDETLAAAGHVVVHSDGAGVIAGALATANPAQRVTIGGLPSKLAYLRDDLPRSLPDEAVRSRVVLMERSVFERPPAADVVLLVRALDEHPDADAVRVLRQAAAGLEPDGAVVVVDHPLDEESDDDHGPEEDLRNLVLYGTGHRTDAENRALFDAAGLRLDATRTVGWGFTLHVLRAR